MQFEIRAEKDAGDTKIFYYDNVTNTLSAEDGFVFEIPMENQQENAYQYTEVRAFSKDDPLRKSKNINVLKIHL
jgi:hypothetical protein